MKIIHIEGMAQHASPSHKVKNKGKISVKLRKCAETWDGVGGSAVPTNDVKNMGSFQIHLLLLFLFFPHHVSVSGFTTSLHFFEQGSTFCLG